MFSKISIKYKSSVKSSPWPPCPASWGGVARACHVVINKIIKRIKWLEFNEKSNKYFLNINKSAYNKSYFKSFVSEGVETFNIKDKIDAAYDFFSDLYSDSPVIDPAVFLNLIHVNPIVSENCLDAP